MSRLGVRILVSIGAVAISGSVVHAMGQRPAAQATASSVTVEEFVAYAHYFNRCFNSHEMVFPSLSPERPYEVFRPIGEAEESSADFYDGLTGQFYSIVAGSRAMGAARDSLPWGADFCTAVQAGEARVTFPVMRMGVLYASAQERCERPVFVAGAVARPIEAADALFRAQIRLREIFTRIAEAGERDIVSDSRLHRSVLHVARSCGVFLDESSRAQLNSLVELIAP